MSSSRPVARGCAWDRHARRRARTARPTQLHTRRLSHRTARMPGNTEVFPSIEAVRCTGRTRRPVPGLGRPRGMFSGARSGRRG
jgi:hypothetical protein